MILFVVNLVLIIRLGAGITVPTQLGKAPRISSRIVGGQNADISSYPYQLSLEYFGQHSCGAALIAPTWAITAAHCTDGTITPFLTVRAGSSYEGRYGQQIRVRAKYHHPWYNRQLIDYDVALLQLSAPVTVAQAGVIPLTGSNNIVQEGMYGTVTGWGTTSESGNLAKQLQVVTVPIINQEQCRQSYGATSITDRMFCAGVDNGGKDSCQGDSGGPMAYNGVLIGIVSWGIGCARPNQPGVYTNVALVRDFVRQVAGI